MSRNLLRGDPTAAASPHRDELLPGFLTWTSLAVLALLVLITMLVIASLRVVPEGERLVVSRLGRPPTVRGPGRALVVPGVDRWVRVPLRWSPMDVWLEASTRDGVLLRLKAIVLVAVSDPARHALRPVPQTAAVSFIVEGRLRRHIADRDLNELGGLTSDQMRLLTSDLDEAVGEWGLTVTLLEVVRADVPLAGLNRWLADRAPAPPQ
ncbi:MULTISPECIES: SPFH domain-containing protein [unclassified Actinomadura]|uniref:SPFH domain-containing protein n=1 Tax=unclassified Actinomadura TaxID=2626254 RepID=UPI0011EFB45E|nr:SPFH domain-containing protein [Actinomadura sp. K4S16]